MPQSKVVGLHLDLKYLMPRKTYLQQWVRELPSLGINTLLIEYEDKFPYETYPFIQGPGAFTPDELRAFLAAAREVGLQVLPLVQTLSHLEFALAHEQLAPLRELPDIPTQINTSSPQAIAFVRTLIDEVLAYHEPDAMFCLGADETWHLGHNADTARVIQAKGKVGMWVDHELQFIEHVKAAGKRAVVWDDIFWSDPDAAGRSDLPRDVILASWGYARTEPSDGARNRVRSYQAAGFDVWGAPCLNWGVMLPQHDHCLGNTSAWAEVLADENAAGIMNTSWACFSVLQPAAALQIAATGAASTGNPRLPREASWQQGFLEGYFGCDAADVPAALRAVGELYEVPIPGLARPLTPVVYGYMDLLLHYGTIEKRMAWGGYPLRWDDIDVHDLMKQKLQLLKQANRDGSVTARLTELGIRYDAAEITTTRLATEATKHSQEAGYIAICARTKALHARIMRHLLAGEGDCRALAEQWDALREPLAAALSPFLEDAAVGQIMRLWWEATAGVLSGALATA